MAKILLSRKMDDKYTLVLYQENGSLNYNELLFKFIVNQVGIAPKGIKEFNFDFDNPDVKNALPYMLGIVVDTGDLEIKNPVNVVDVFDKGFIEVNDYFITFDTVDMKIIKDFVNEAIKNIEFNDIEEFLVAVAYLYNGAVNTANRHQYIRKLYTLPLFITDIYLAAAKNNKIAEELYKIMLKKPVESYISYYVGRAVPLVIKKSQSVKVNKILKKAASDIYRNIYEDITKRLLNGVI